MKIEARTRRITGHLLDALFDAITSPSKSAGGWRYLQTAVDVDGTRYDPGAAWAYRPSDVSLVREVELDGRFTEETVALWGADEIRVLDRD